MSDAASDYARAAAYLDRSRLPAFVSFIEQASARGLAHEGDGPNRIIVRISDGAVVEGPRGEQSFITDKGGSGENPFRRPLLFDTQCYIPQREDATRWNDLTAVRFTLKDACGDDNRFTELYADPRTLRPIAADGNIDSGEANMTVAIELRYAWLGQYTVPSSVSAHATGHGWLFWARERARIDYAEYQFFQTDPVVRRQAGTPIPRFR